MACSLTAAELADIHAATLTQSGEIRRRTSQTSAWASAATAVPCLLTLTGSPREQMSPAAHEDEANAQLLVAPGTDIRQNDAVLVNGARFVVRLLDPFDEIFLRCLGRVEK